MQTISADVLFHPEADELKFLPEGPIDLGGGRFSWVGIQHGPDSTIGSLNLFDMKTGTNEHFPLEGRPGFAFPTDNPGEFLIGLERRLILFQTQTGLSQTIVEGVDGDVAGTIINDGVDFPEGVIFGTKELTFTKPLAALYFLDKNNLKLTKLIGGQICSNGKVIRKTHWGHALLDIDTPTKKVVSYRLNLEKDIVSEPETVLDLADVDAFPDGMVGTPDGEGVIISFYNPNDVEFGETRLYSLDSGECQIVWQTPKSPQNTCPLLIEHDGIMKLVITTAVEHMPAERQQKSTNSGCLFVSDTPI